jgi:hypothetical protein
MFSHSLLPLFSGVGIELTLNPPHHSKTEGCGTLKINCQLYRWTGVLVHLQAPTAA